MAMNLKNTWNHAKEPLLVVCMGVLIFLGVKSCNNSSKNDGTNEAIVASIDSIKQETRADADTIKAYVKATYPIVERTEKKVDTANRKLDTISNKIDTVQKTADSILTVVEECCDCKKENKKPVVKKTEVAQDTVVKKSEPKKPVVKPEPKKTNNDTIVVSKLYYIKVECVR